MLAIGAPTEGDHARAPGAVIVAQLFAPRSDAESWSHATEAVLVSPRGGLDAFGTSVCLYGDALVVGAPLANGAGEVRTFARGSHDAQSARRHWTERRPLLPVQSVQGAEFGASIAIGGPSARPIVAVGARRSDMNSGEVHLFELADALEPPSSASVQTDALKPRQTLASPTGAAGAWFGMAIAAGERWLAVSAPGERVGALAGAGSVHVFEFDADGNARLHCSIHSPRPTAHGWFGAALALDRSALLIGEPRGLVAGARCGRAWLVDLSALDRGMSEPPATASLALEPPLTEPGLGYGQSVAIGRGMIMVGAPGFDGATEDEGTAWIHDRTGAVVDMLHGPRREPMSLFGSSATIACAGGRPAIAIGHLYVEEESPAPSAGCAVFGLNRAVRTTSPASTSIPPPARRR